MARRWPMLDASITILQRAETQEDTFGTMAVAWLPFDTDFAELQDMMPSRAERIADGIEIARRPRRIRLRWRDDVSTANRIRLEDGTELRVVAGPAEIYGRRRYIELIAEELTTEGQEL